MANMYWHHAYTFLLWYHKVSHNAHHVNKPQLVTATFSSKQNRHVTDSRFVAEIPIYQVALKIISNCVAKK